MTGLSGGRITRHVADSDNWRHSVAVMTYFVASTKENHARKGGETKTVKKCRIHVVKARVAGDMGTERGHLPQENVARSAETAVSNLTM